MSYIAPFSHTGSGGPAFSCAAQLLVEFKSVVRFCEKVKNHKPDVTLSGRYTITGALPDAAPLPTVARLENGLPEMPDLK